MKCSYPTCVSYLLAGMLALLFANGCATTPPKPVSTIELRQEIDDAQQQLRVLRKWRRMDQDRNWDYGSGQGNRYASSGSYSLQADHLQRKLRYLHTLLEREQQQERITQSKVESVPQVVN